jgi:prepilin-type processing-associated H-X9-DG protein
MYHILPHLEQQRVYESSQFLGFAIPTYQCPSDGNNPGVLEAYAGAGGTVPYTIGLTSYVAVTGSNDYLTDGIITYRPVTTSLTGIPDGASNTLMVAERPVTPDKYVGYWYFGGSPHDGLAARTSFNFVWTNGPGAGTDCTSRVPGVFAPGKMTDYCDANHFWSGHPGGANFLFGDGSVRFLAYSASPLIVPMATKAGGEVVDVP